VRTAIMAHWNVHYIVYRDVNHNMSQKEKRAKEHTFAL